MDRKIIDYIVIVLDLRKIEGEVKEYLSKWYVPQWWICILSNFSDTVLLYQAMVKYEPLPDDEFDYLKDYDPTKYDPNNNTPMFETTHPLILDDKDARNK